MSKQEILKTFALLKRLKAIQTSVLIHSDYRSLVCNFKWVKLMLKINCSAMIVNIALSTQNSKPVKFPSVNFSYCYYKYSSP
jgi:hypothetical protein